MCELGCKSEHLEAALRPCKLQASFDLLFSFVSCSRRSINLTIFWDPCNESCVQKLSPAAWCCTASQHLGGRRVLHMTGWQTYYKPTSAPLTPSQINEADLAKLHARLAIIPQLLQCKLQYSYQCELHTAMQQSNGCQEALAMAVNGQ
jgi:hypothetical protein